MKRHLLTKMMLLLFALVVGSSNVWAAITPGDYSAIYTSNVTLSTTGGTSASTAKVKVTSTDSGYDAIKAGTGSTKGAVQIAVPAGTKYLHLHAAAWKGETVSLTVTQGETTITSISLTADSGISNNSPFTLSNSAAPTTNLYKIITFDNALESETNIKLTASTSTTGKRFVIWGVNAEALPTGIIIKNGNTAINSLDMTLGDADVTLSAVVAPNLANQAVTWSIQDNGVATISNAGVVHAVTAGTATITATSKTDDSKTATCELTVASASSPTVTISTTDLDFGEVAVGKTKQMTFKITPANLTGDLTISANKEYTVLPTSIPQATNTEQTITVTAAPTDISDDMDGTVTISGGGIAQKTVALTTTLYQEATVTLVAADNHGTFKQGDDVVTSITSRVGSTATIKAIPNDGYLFSSWTAVGATPASSETAETEFTFTATSVTLTANFVVDNREFVTLEGSDIANMTGSTGYGNVKTITKNDLTWSTTGYKQNATDEYIQLKAGSPYPYVKIPEFPGAIQTITFSVTNTGASAKDGAKTDGTLRFRTINSNSATNIVSGGGSSTNEIVLDFTALDQKYSTGYIFLSGSGARIWDITVAYIPAEDYDINFTDTKYATFCDYVARDFKDTGLKAYKAKVNEGKVALTEISNGKVPANTGVILYGDAGDYSIPVTTSSSAITENELIGVTTRTLVEWTTGGDGKKNYILQGGVFKKAATGGHLKANRAYLHTSYDVTTSSARDYLEFSFDDEPTVIETVKVENAHNEYFNLAGQRVANPTKGLYIVNGRKVVVK